MFLSGPVFFGPWCPGVTSAPTLRRTGRWVRPTATPGGNCRAVWAAACAASLPSRAGRDRAGGNVVSPPRRVNPPSRGTESLSGIALVGAQPRCIGGVAPPVPSVGRSALFVLVLWSCIGVFLLRRGSHAFQRSHAVRRCRAGQRWEGAGLARRYGRRAARGRSVRCATSAGCGGVWVGVSLFVGVRRRSW